MPDGARLNLTSPARGSLGHPRGAVRRRTFTAQEKRLSRIPESLFRSRHEVQGAEATYLGRRAERVTCRRSMGCVRGEGTLSLESGGVSFSLTWRKGREG